MGPDEKQAADKEKPAQPVAEAEVNTEEREKTTEEQEKIKEIQALKKKRAAECTREFGELLKKYNCFTQVSVQFTTHGKPRWDITIHAR